MPSKQEVRRPTVDEMIAKHEAMALAREEAKNRAKVDLQTAVASVIDELRLKYPEPHIINVTAADSGFGENHWFFVEYYSKEGKAIDIDVVNLLGLDNGSPHGYDMVTPKQNSELFFEFKTILMTALEVLGYQVEQGTLRSEFFHLYLNSEETAATE